ncbi:HAD-like domain-containing protein [Zychaea mexicana]|uniref:HAD-like domain-containing protein n=1 Tax=Zychaea mexicana TaxID=64656 RepID=UPI0022FE83BD|nr:HAD-like domain-containing protein [Zychaea mexicana]KAI9491764.1 HAD-like domain-containing protein [Zychaea mexicana]
MGTPRSAKLHDSIVLLLLKNRAVSVAATGTVHRSYYKALPRPFTTQRRCQKLRSILPSDKNCHSSGNIPHKQDLYYNSTTVTVEQQQHSYCPTKYHVGSHNNNASPRAYAIKPPTTTMTQHDYQRRGFIRNQLLRSTSGNNNNNNSSSSKIRSFSSPFTFYQHNRHFHCAKRQLMTGTDPSIAPNPLPRSSDNITDFDNGGNRGRGRGRGRGPGRGRGQQFHNTNDGEFHTHQRHFHYQSSSSHYSRGRHEVPFGYTPTARQTQEYTSYSNKKQGLPSSLLTRQSPRESYMKLSQQPSTVLAEPIDDKKLLILDLNGTLASRTTNRRSMYVRPYQDKFLDYIFRHFKVMVWSSAQPHSVNSMCRLFGSYVDDLLLTWDRRYFNLSTGDYNRKTVTLKDLEVVWRALGQDTYDASNTILVDDSPAKAILQPYNSIHLKEFDHTSPTFRKYGEAELLHVVRYLEQVRIQSNVCSFMREQPFVSPDPSQDKENEFRVYHYVFDQEGRRLHSFEPKEPEAGEAEVGNESDDDDIDVVVAQLEQKLKSTTI